MSMEQKQWMECPVREEDIGRRLDVVLAESLNDLSRSYIQKLIKDCLIRVNEKPTKANVRLDGSERIEVMLPEPEVLSILPVELPLDILYEDEDLIVLNKEKGRVVHPAPGHFQDTLVNGLLFHCKDQLSGINGVLRPGIVHRIDKDTSGVLVVCKNDRSHRMIAEQLKEHSITRKYNAIAHGYFKESEGTVDAPLNRHPTERKKRAIDRKNGKRAVTHYRVLEELKQELSFIECQLETGRTHQIRVHMASLGHPLIGDTLYGPKKTFGHIEGQVLHARVLGFFHPTLKKYMEFEAPLPEEFQQILTKFKKES